MGYVSIDALKSTLELTGETYADDDITMAINTASEQINSQCNRRFTLDPDNTSVRLYQPYSPTLFDIDDIVDVQQIAVGFGDGTYPNVLTANTNYEMAPLNAAADGLPYTRIRILSNCVGYGSRVRVQVTGQFGWPAVPELVLGATTLLASRLLKRFREAPFGIVQVGLDGQVARIAITDPDVCALLGPVTRLMVR